MIAADPAARPKSSRFIAMAIAAVVAAGCGDSGPATTADDPNDSPPLRSTPEGLFQQMETAFATRDSALLADLLDERFICDPLYDPPGAYPGWYCARTTYLHRIGKLFRDSTLAGLTLDVAITTNVSSTDETCLDCRSMQASATLRIDVMPPDNDEPLAFSVDTPVTFVAAPDPRDPKLWVLRKQVASTPFAERVPLNATDWLHCNCHRGVIIN